VDCALYTTKGEFINSHGLWLVVATRVVVIFLRGLTPISLNLDYIFLLMCIFSNHHKEEYELQQERQAAQAAKKQKLSSRHKHTSLTQSFSHIIGYGSMYYDLFVIYIYIMYITEDSLHRKAIDRALVKMIAIDLQPGSIVEDRGFQEFLKVIDPKYIPPSRRTIMRDYLPGLYENATEELHRQLMRVEHCSITTDLWTSQATMGYVTVTCHFLTDDWEIKSAVLDTVQIQDSHTAENIGALFLSITDKWDITKFAVQSQTMLATWLQQCATISGIICLALRIPLI